MSPERTKLTPPEVARQWGANIDKVRTWIKHWLRQCADVAVDSTAV